MDSAQERETGTLQDLDEWEDDLLRRYPEHPESDRKFRAYEAEARPGVREFYRLNHQHQTMDFVLQKRAEYLFRSQKKRSHARPQNGIIGVRKGIHLL